MTLTIGMWSVPTVFSLVVFFWPIATKTGRAGRYGIGDAINYLFVFGMKTILILTVWLSYFILETLL